VPSDSLESCCSLPTRKRSKEPSHDWNALWIQIAFVRSAKEQEASISCSNSWGAWSLHEQCNWSRSVIWRHLNGNILVQCTQNCTIWFTRTWIRIQQTPLFSATESWRILFANSNSPKPCTSKHWKKFKMRKMFWEENDSRLETREKCNDHRKGRSDFYFLLACASRYWETCIRGDRSMSRSRTTRVSLSFRRVSLSFRRVSWSKICKRKRNISIRTRDRSHSFHSEDDSQCW
jgi:hypothetical protein